jgi:putative flippase GtrA
VTTPRDESSLIRRDSVRRWILDLVYDPTVRKQFIRFVLVGVSNTIISLVVFRFLIAVGTWYVIAAPLSYMASLMNGYLFNRSWTYGASDSLRARTLYVVVQLGGAGITALFVVLLVAGFGLSRLVAFCFAVLPATLCTFTANRRWTFASRAG